jgi:hypothetical protein
VQHSRASVFVCAFTEPDGLPEGAGGVVQLAHPLALDREQRPNARVVGGQASSAFEQQECFASVTASRGGASAYHESVDPEVATHALGGREISLTATSMSHR